MFSRSSSLKRWYIREMPMATNTTTMIHFQKWKNRISGGNHCQDQGDPSNRLDKGAA